MSWGKVLILTNVFFTFYTLAGPNQKAHLSDKPHKYEKNPKIPVGSGAKSKKVKSSDPSLLKSVGKKAVVEVQGMVCSFCAQGIERNFKKQKQVQSVSVDMDKMKVSLLFQPGASLSEAEIKKIIEGAGFKFVDVKYE